MPAKPGARCSRHRIPGWGERLRRKPASPSLGLRGRGANDAAAAAAAAAAASTAETRLEMGRETYLTGEFGEGAKQCLCVSESPL
ncbi:uncharacterized protein LOC132675820 isoform X3 [Panthera onca]